MAMQDPMSVIDEFDARWNAHDEAGIMDYVTDDVVIRLAPPPPPPLREVYTGKQQVQEFMRALLPGFHVTSSDHRVSGDRVTWTFKVSADAFRQMGVDQATGTAEAIVQQGKIRSLNPTFDAATVKKLQAGRAIS